MKKEYEGSCYIGVVSGRYMTPEAFVSISRIHRRNGDDFPWFHYATKGFEVRQMHLDRWMKTDHAFMLLLDGDMTFEPDTLERLRSHKMPYVSGYYMRRRNPTYPVWFEPWYNEHTDDVGAYPPRPFFKVPERDRLHPLGGSGWGCILIHRDVVSATKKILKGEPEIIEDDMDVWPYDLDAVLAGREELRPLTGDKGNIGSDVRYPFFAAAAGFPLMGDANVRPGHEMDALATPDGYDDSHTEETVKEVEDTWFREFGAERLRDFEERRARWSK